MSSEKRILYVEDSLDNQMLLSYYVKKSPYLVEFALDGPTAFKKLQDNVYDFALIDMNLTEEMTGIELAEKVRNELNNPDLPIAILSAFSAAELKEKAGTLSIQEFITKPIKKDALLSVFQKYIGS